MEGLLCPFWVCAFVVSEFGDDSLINAFRTCQLKRMEGDFMALFGAFWWTLQGSCSKGLRLGLRFISCSDCSPIIGKCSLGYLHVYLSECIFLFSEAFFICFFWIEDVYGSNFVIM
ncbi:hypothetical protein KC19_9G103300 [Ceratodon purpureus]|uniref:Uncharacterized protein n=1 Tax=Ceratodon purpureus TaxID=3225 RepID=A0A8T0GU88_CERPU|nr:hypothetical protein KC19_9G103300 [Ceratodon purpureus]